MQKRTNPLELKLETKMPPAQVVEPEVVEPDEPILEATVELPAVEETVEETVSCETVSEAVEQTEESVAEQPAAKQPVKKRVTKSKPRATTETGKKQEAPKKTPTPSVIEEDVRRSPLMNGDMRWQRVVLPSQSEPVKTPDPTDVFAAPVAKTGSFFRPVVEEEPVEEVLEEQTPEPVFAQPEQEAVADAYEEQAQPETQDYIDDEAEALTLEDYEMSVRFGLCGRISRATKLTSISRDVCRLAQLMHPGQSLSTILENALLTRIYLENRDAFDAMAEMLEKKGGHIKC